MVEFDGKEILPGGRICWHTGPDPLLTNDFQRKGSLFQIFSSRGKIFLLILNSPSLSNRFQSAEYKGNFIFVAKPLQNQPFEKPIQARKMKKYLMILAIFALLGMVALVLTLSLRTVTPAEDAKAHSSAAVSDFSNANPGTMITLPAPNTTDGMSLTQALSLRRSIRTYSEEPVSLQEVSQLLWSAQGITNERGFRTAPSAGATFPLELYLMANNVEGLKKGIYHYHPLENGMEFIREGNLAPDLARACLSQAMVSDAGVVLIFAAVFERTTARYGERGIRYVHNEIGHAAQNVHLQAAAIDLGTVVIGAYRDEEVEQILDLGDELRVLYLMPVGPMP